MLLHQRLAVSLLKVLIKDLSVAAYSWFCSSL
jgi:hypothetical protein